MSTQQLATALGGLLKTPSTFGTQMNHTLLLHFAHLCLSLFTLIGERVHQVADPRLTLAHARHVEAMAQQVHAQQLVTALDVELTAAHTLTLDTLNTVNDADFPFDTEPERVTGRTVYRDAASLLAAWWNITVFEARNRLRDAHLLVGRRTISGAKCAPRFSRLAELYAAGTTDRRAIAQIARRLDTLEPADTTFDGIDTTLSATTPNGVLLEEVAASALTDRTLVEARREINARIREYKDAHDRSEPPEIGIFARGVTKGVHYYTVRANAVGAQLIDSIRAQAGKKHAAGKATRAHFTGQANACGATKAAKSNPGSTTDSPENQQEVPAWLRSEDPIPDWARGPGGSQTAEDDDPTGDHGAQDPAVNTDETAPADEDMDDEDEVDSSIKRPERELNAILYILQKVSTGQGGVKTVTPRIHVRMWLTDLIRLAEHAGLDAEDARTYGITAHGGKLTAGQLRQLLARAQIIPIVLGSNSQPLDVGRASRVATGAIDDALAIRDIGCIAPGCTTPPEQAEADHYKRSWADGGTTSISNLVLLCNGNHVGRHLGQLRIVDVDGLPHVLLPEHVDPTQTPRRNTLWGALQLGDAPSDPGDGPSPNPDYTI